MPQLEHEESGPTRAHIAEKVPGDGQILWKSALREQSKYTGGGGGWLVFENHAH